MIRTAEPVVSVLLPVFNGGHHVGRAVDSILRQSFTDFELLVIDDGSTDSTTDELSRRRAERRLRVIVHEHNEGLVATLNHGLALCRGGLIARLDADDWSSTDRLRRQVALFNSRPNLVLVASAYDRIDDQLRPIRRGVPPVTHAALAIAMLTGNRIQHSTVMFRRDAVRGVGGYDESWFPVEDYDLWLRLLEVGEFAALTSSEVTYTERPGSISSLRSRDQAQQVARRARRYLEELSGVALEVHRPLGVRDVALAAGFVRQHLRRRGVPTTGLDQQALMVANSLLRDRSRLGRTLRVLGAAPRIAVLGRFSV